MVCSRLATLDASLIIESAILRFGPTVLRSLLERTSKNEYLQSRTAMPGANNGAEVSLSTSPMVLVVALKETFV
jgi:hypothetical protein